MPASSCSRSSAIHPRQAERGGQQPRRFRREIEPAGVGAAHDRRQPQQRLGVARPNSSTMMSKVQSSPRWLQNTSSTSNGRRAEALGDRDHLGRRDEQEHGVRIDEAADQPGAGDAVDLRPRPGHPDGAASRIARGQLCGRHQRQPGGLPGFKAAFERLGRHAVPQPGGDALAELLAPLADHDGGAAGELLAPIGRRPGGSAARRRESGAGRRRNPRRCGRRSGQACSPCRSGGQACLEISW